jgi:hypothetical protein
MTMQFEGALETRCSALQRQYEGQLTEMKEEMKTLKNDIKGVYYVMEQKNHEDALYRNETEQKAKESKANLLRLIEANVQENKRGQEAIMQGQKTHAQAQTKQFQDMYDMMTQVLMTKNPVSPGYMSQPAQQMLQTSQASPVYLSQPPQVQAAAALSPVTLKRQHAQVSNEGQDEGCDPGLYIAMDTEFTIQIIMPGVEMKEENHIVSSDLTLAMLKDKLIVNMRNNYEFVTSY